jgi:hypothetical protein
VVQQYPSFLGYPRTAYHSKPAIPPGVTSATGRQAIQALQAQRCETFLHHLGLYGERSIHHRTSLERYVRQHIPHYLSLRQRRQHIRHWITLLESYKYYEVGLADTLPTLEPRLKSTVQAMLRGTPSYDRNARGASRGPQYLHWFDEGSVLAFYLDFEQHWDTIPLEYRTKSSVITWLQQLLDS